ncbi:MAG: glycosyltransferase family 4 protein [Planctomycetaceae bacterium]|nr:glycosyltransferase family 4 protein [Planctomycetaceae bacterium]
MHVAILCEYGSINGGENSLLAVLDHCPDDVQITVLAPPEGRFAEALKTRRLTHIPFSLHDNDGRRFPPIEAATLLAPVVEFVQPDLLHGNSLSTGRITGLLSQQTGMTCTAHLRDIISLSKTAIRHLNGNCKLIAVSHATRDFHIEQGLDPDRVKVLYNGVDCERFQPRRGDGCLRRELELDDDVLIALTIGQISMRKGLDVLVEAAVLHASSLPQLHHVIVGVRHSSKPEAVAFEQGLHDRVEESGLTNRFHWLGYRDDIALLLNECDLLIHPARQEPFGRVLLEAAASGVPIIATNVGGTTEILAPAKSGILIAPDNTDAIIASITLLTIEEPLRTRLGNNARDTIYSHFKIQDKASEILMLWREAIS